MSQHHLATFRVLRDCGVITPYPPMALLRSAAAFRRWGMGPAGGFSALAARDPHGAGLVDDRGTLTWQQLDTRSTRLARGLRDLGVSRGTVLGLMCRNHRGFVETAIAASKLGADVLYLNTAFAGPQLAEVVDREKTSFLVHDSEFESLLSNIDVPRIIAWTDDPGTDSAFPTVEGLIAATPQDQTPLAPVQTGRTVILTSGTTGTPKGAPRPQGGVGAAVSLLSRLPLRTRWRSHIAAPLFHTWGFAHFQLAMLLGTTMVLRSRFEPTDALRTIVEQRCDSLVAVPVMLQRMLMADSAVLEIAIRHHNVQVVASSGSALPGDLAAQWMNAFGDNLFSTYGSTEVAWASIATPEELRQFPDTAGRPPHATTVAILDTDGHPVAAGTTGRIFVGNGLQFSGYSNGGGKEVLNGLMASGDVGHRAKNGLLFVSGRDDEMIVSGGENVFPQEVEDCLAQHPSVREAAAFGVADEEFGQRLRAFVVLDPTHQPQPTSHQLQLWVRDRLARYKVPREIIAIDELPRNATGKVLKQALTID